MIPTARVQRGPSEAARCASTGIVPAAPPIFSILLKRLDYQLQMHTIILQVSVVNLGRRIQTLPPVQLKSAPPPEIPDRSDSHAPQPLRSRVDDSIGVPSPAVIEKWYQVHKFFPDRRCVHWNTSLKGSQEDIVPELRELPITSHAVAPADRHLLHKEQVLVRQLQIGSRQQCDARGVQPPDQLRLAQPGKKFSGGLVGPAIDGRSQNGKTETHPGQPRDDLILRAMHVLLCEAQRRHLGQSVGGSKPGIQTGFQGERS